MPLRPVLKTVNVLLALAAFLVVGVLSVLRGEEAIWVVGKAAGSFVICWVVLGWLAGLLSYGIEGDEPEALEDPAPAELSATGGEEKG